MSVIEISSPCAARVWLGELPSLRADSPQVTQRGLEVGHSVPQSKAATAALEVFIPRGARFIYGLLACEFVPSDSKELMVQVASSQSGQTITDWSLARGLDDVKTGIPKSAAEDILKAALEAAETIGPGYLRFPSGAHGVIGSNTWVFRGLAKAIVTLISTDDRSVPDDEVASILRRHFF